MNAEISNIINLVMKMADFYEENLGEEVFPADRTVSLKNVLLNDLATYSLLLCSADGNVSDERIKTINYYFSQNLPIGNADAVNKIISDTKEEYLEYSPIGLKALVTLENELHRCSGNYEGYISNYYILLFDLMLHLGNDNYVNLDKVKLITAANAEKVRKYRTDRNIDKNSDAFFNGSSDKETRSIPKPSKHGIDM